jgi:hypothetical protein
MDWETRMTLYYYLKQILHIRPTCRVLYIGGDSTILLADYVTHGCRGENGDGEPDWLWQQ